VQRVKDALRDPMRTGFTVRSDRDRLCTLFDEFVETVHRMLT
jgi:hypothetical protein